VQAAILPPTGDGFWANLTQPAAISPDGKFLAIVAMHNGQRQLWLRGLNASEAQLIAGSDDAANPFWSPDSRHIAFFAYGKLRKVDVAGGQVSDLSAAGNFNLGGAWSSRGDILFAPFADTLKHVSENGGLAESIPGIPLSDGFLGQQWPIFFPDGKHFAYLEWKYPSAGKEENTVWIGSLDGQPRRRLPLTSTNVEFSGGYLLFRREGDLFAQKFDPDHFELKGAALPIARNIQFATTTSFTVSKNGILVYAPAGTGVNSRLTWMDRNGASLAILGDPQHFETQAISPDGKRVIVGIKPANARENLWIYDVERGTRVPLDPSDTGPALYSCRWSPDGKQVAYRNTVEKSSALLVRDSDGSGHEKQIGGQFDGAVTVEDWSPDGKYLLVNHSQFLGKQNWHDNLQVLPVAGEDKPLLAMDNAMDGKFSPDGHWLAYYDGNTGQVYVRPLGRAGGAIAVSSSGGSDPRWRGDGQELFYITDELMLVSVQVRESAQEFRVLSSHPLFRIQLPSNVGFYDVTRDGKRFLVNARTPQEQIAPLTLVTNWTAPSK
jgi:Tol biopolymer transport system component